MAGQRDVLPHTQDQPPMTSVFLHQERCYKDSQVGLVNSLWSLTAYLSVPRNLQIPTQTKQTWHPPVQAAGP